MRQRRTSVIVAVAATVAATLGATGRQTERLLGFSDEGSVAERRLEARFDAQLEPAEMRGWLERITAHPHHTGSAGGREVAELAAGLLRAWGYETVIERFDVLMPTPRVRVLELVAPTRFTARLVEPPVAGDRTSTQQSEQLPIYNAYSVDGDVTGELVYANYGLPDDYDELERRGIDVRGRIVLVRYGGSWRGIKPKVAAEHGAIGCVIFSDPREDGFFQGDPYPQGGYRPADGAQRGSVLDMPLYPGDPLTPGVGATPEAHRLPLKEAATLTTIPVLPISAADARPLLTALAGTVAPEGWRGALPLTYHIGPGPARVHLKLAFDWRQTPVYDVIAKLPGADRPEQWILRGNHHDAWVYGAADPVSGVVALLEEARAVSELARSGWRPRRTIVYALWDGEEQGLLGSTEWLETHAAELAGRVAVYVNTDSNGRGFFSAGGSPALEPLVNQAGREVADPRKGVDVITRALAAQRVRGDEQGRKVAESGTLRLDALGSGSDFTPFLQHLGVAALNIGFGGEEEYGQYHSIYDSFDHFSRFVDPDLAYGVALAKVAGRIVLRLADADVLPFDLVATRDAVARWLDDVEDEAATLRAETASHNRLIAADSFSLAASPYRAYVPPVARAEVPHFNFAPLDNAAARLTASVAAWQKAREGAADRPLPAARATELDRALIGVESACTRPQGLPGRPWFRHYLYAPGVYAGYGVRTLPAVREALEQRRFADVEPAVKTTAEAIEALAVQIDRATALLAPPPAT